MKAKLQAIHGPLGCCFPTTGSQGALSSPWHSATSLVVFKDLLSALPLAVQDTALKALLPAETKKYKMKCNLL